MSITQKVPLDLSTTAYCAALADIGGKLITLGGLSEKFRALAPRFDTVVIAAGQPHGAASQFRPWVEVITADSAEDAWRHLSDSHSVALPMCPDACSPNGKVWVGHEGDIAHIWRLEDS